MTDQKQNTETPPLVPEAEKVSPASPSVQIDNYKLWSIVSYIPFLFIIPLIVVQNRSAFLNYHINQGILLSLVAAVGYFGLDLLPWWSRMVFMIAWIWKLVMLALLIVGIRNVLEKQMKPLPVIGKLFTFLK